MKSYPFPVLGNGDDISGQFNPKLKYTLEAQSVTIECEFEISNSSIEKLISEGKATYFVQVECGSTFYRRTFTTSDNKLTIEIIAGDLRDKVDVGFYVCSTEDIDDYSPEGIHPDLEGEPTFVEKGDVLADGGTGSFMADKEFDPLKAPVSSFMRIKESSEHTGNMTMDYGNDQIIIKLAKDDYEKYMFARKYAVATLHSSLVFPALLDALNAMKTNDYQDMPWYDRIRQICRERSIDLEDSLTAAQQLLGKPVGRGLAEINEKTTEDGGEIYE